MHTQTVMSCRDKIIPSKLLNTARCHINFNKKVKPDFYKTILLGGEKSN